MYNVVIDYIIFLYIDKFQWSCPEWKGISSRYEHSAFIPDCNPREVYVFGGAQQATNLNDVQVLDLGTLLYVLLKVFIDNHVHIKYIYSQMCFTEIKIVITVRLDISFCRCLRQLLSICC